MDATQTLLCKYRTFVYVVRHNGLEIVDLLLRFVRANSKAATKFITACVHKPANNKIDNTHTHTYKKLPLKCYFNVGGDRYGGIIKLPHCIVSHSV